MFGLLSRAPRQARPFRPSFRPALERLEARDCPTSIGLSFMLSATSTSVYLYGSATNAPPNTTVQFSGVASGSVALNSSGGFNLQLTATGLGVETATTSDGASAQVTLTDYNAPLISSFTTTEFQGGYVMFSGHVNGTVFAGEQITFGGSIPALKGQTVTVNSYGTFSFVAHLQTGDDGTVTAAATPDVWGVNNTASCTLDV